jgi:hypothetical protein
MIKLNVLAQLCCLQNDGVITANGMNQLMVLVDACVRRIELNFTMIFLVKKEFASSSFLGVFGEVSCMFLIIY